MKKLVLLWISLVLFTSGLLAQCDLAVDVVDDFDSTRLISAKAVNIGYMIPSKFETLDGPKLVEEAKLIFSYTENDSINCFFITLAIAEYNYEYIDVGFNVLIRLSNGEVIGLYNVPDSGTFDKKTNMRIYTHTCVASLDLFSKLVYYNIEKIRIEYKKQKRTLTLSKQQQDEVKKAIQCVGERLGMFPVKP